MTMLADALAGGHLIHDCGYLESGLTGSLVQLAICDELAGWINALVRPVDVSDEALALDLVEAHGVDGSYLETDHTLTHYRERWYPTLIDRRGYEAWRAGGATTLAQRAAARVEELLAQPRPDPARPRRGARRPRRRRARPRPPPASDGRAPARARAARAGARPPAPHPVTSPNRHPPRTEEQPPMTDTEFQAMRQAVIDGDADAAEAAAKAAHRGRHPAARRRSTRASCPA